MAKERTKQETVVKEAAEKPETPGEAAGKKTAGQARKAARSAGKKEKQECAEKPDSVMEEAVAGKETGAGTALQPKTQAPVKLTEAQLQKEFKKRAGIIRKQMDNIQQSFLLIAFQLYWIKDNDMYSPMGYKNIYEFAETEYGIGRSSCSNLICIVDIYAQRDELGNVVEAITERYRDFTSSQLVAMMGMTEEARKRITPDMSVRLINRIRKQEAQARIGTIRSAAADTEERKSQTQEADVGAESAAGPESVRESSAGAEKAKDVINSGSAGTDNCGEGAGVQPDNRGNTFPASGKDKEAAGAVITEGGSGKPSPGVAVHTETSVASVMERKEPQKTVNTLLSFDSYSKFQKEIDHIRTVVENIFRQEKKQVRVKIVCEQETA